jgi:hypothetical protein
MLKVLYCSFIGVLFSIIVFVSTLLLYTLGCFIYSLERLLTFKRFKLKDMDEEVSYIVNDYLESIAMKKISFPVKKFRRMLDNSSDLN